MAKIEQELKDIPEIENYNVSVGKSIGTANGTSYGMFVLKLRHWDEREGREHSADASVWSADSLSVHWRYSSSHPRSSSLLSG